jgi:hypothetical protein
MKINNFTIKAAATTVVVATSITTAQAALPAAAQAAVDSISTFGTDIIDAAWPIATMIVVASIGIKLFKKFSSKAT